MHRWTWLKVLLFVLAGAEGSQAACFEPLTDPNSHDPAKWKDLVNFVPPASVRRPSEVATVLAVAAGRGDKINLDYYSLTFQKHPTKSLQEFFREVRLHFDDFAQADNGVDRFGPYQIKTVETDAVRKRNAELWQSQTPTGALMTFVLDSIGLGRSRDRLFFSLKYGDVFVGCASPTDFIFSTVKSSNTQGITYHPVSGNRGFGLKDNGDGTWTFYSKGADRETAGETKGFVLANMAARVRFPNRPDEAVFIFGELFWDKFFAEMISFLKKQGLATGDKALIKNSGHRYAYPLPPIPAPLVADTSKWYGLLEDGGARSRQTVPSDSSSAPDETHPINSAGPGRNGP